MRRLASLVLVALLITLSPGTQAVHAYYDDVHFALTYYMARQNGFTPAQAYRIASACSAVDSDPDTEPVQKTGQALLVFTPLTGFAQNPRWKFHAMRREPNYATNHEGDVIGNGPDGAAQQAGIYVQREALFQQAVDVTKNPGVFLHFFQDEVPHRGYGAAWGHWPMLPGCVQIYKDAKLDIGGKTDWVETRQAEVMAMTEACSTWLQKFMDKVSPHQYWRPYYEAEYQALVAALAKQKAPGALDTELKRQLYVQYYAQSSGWSEKGWENLVDPKDLSDVAAGLKIGLSREELEKLKDGPRLGVACAAVDEALKAAGMPDTIPGAPRFFDLDSDGSLWNEFLLDDWVLVGSLEVTVKAPAAVKATLRMLVRDRNGHAKEMDLPGLDPVTIEPGGTHTWTEIPIGDVILVLTNPDGSSVRRDVTLSKQNNVYPTITLTGGAGDAKGDYTLAMTFEEGPGTSVTISATNPPDDAATSREMYDRFTKSTKGKWALLTLSGGGRTRYHWSQLEDLGVGSMMLAVLSGDLDLPPGTHEVRATTTLLGQSLTAKKQVTIEEARMKDVLEKRLKDAQQALEDAKAGVEGGREEIRKYIREREDRKAELQKALADRDTPAADKAAIEEKIRTLDKEISDWRKTLKLLDPSDGETPGWVDTIKSAMVGAFSHLAAVRSNLGEYGEAQKALDAAGNWGAKPESLYPLRLACARTNFDFRTWEEMAIKAGFEPDYIVMAEEIVRRRNDLGAARSYIAKWKAKHPDDGEPGVGVPPADAEFVP